GVEANIAKAQPLISNFCVHLYINGQQPTGFHLGQYVQSLQLCSNLDFTVTISEVADKIIAVNCGLEYARNSEKHLFFCIDNDIVSPENLVRRMLAVFSSRMCYGVVCEKAPHITRQSSR